MAKQELGALARLYHLGVAKRSTSGGGVIESPRAATASQSVT
jgi:hypothetical protein